MFTTLFRYDTWNRIQSLTYNDGEMLDFNYDSGGLVTQISGVKGAYTYPYLNAMGYDKFSSRVFQHHGNGARTTYAYNANHRRLANITARTASNRTFMNTAHTYDPVGNILALSSARPLTHSGQQGGSSSFTFGYDDLYQLTL